MELLGDAEKGGLMSRVTSDARELLGREPTSFRTWAERHRKEFVM